MLLLTIFHTLSVYNNSIMFIVRRDDYILYIYTRSLFGSNIRRSFSPYTICTSEYRFIIANNNTCLLNTHQPNPYSPTIVVQHNPIVF